MISEDPVERWEQLEHYLAGQLEEEQVRQLEERMKTDKQLADELVSVRQAQALLNNVFVEQEMRNVIHQIRAEKKLSERWLRPASEWNRTITWMAAASLLLIGYLSLAPIMLPDAGYDVQALRRLDTAQIPPQQQLAFTNFFEGQARMVEGDYVQAAHHFENVLTVDDLRPYFREAAEWHLAVSYLRSHQINRASRVYQQLRQCETCTYEVGWIERRKMEWQLLIANLLP